MVAGALSAICLSSSTDFWFVFAGLGGLGIGSYLFISGFRMLRYKRMILNTPLAKIHSASIGLVEVTGTPTGPKTLVAPVTGDACYYYRVQAWQWKESDNKHSWEQVLDESVYLPFFLEDGTGRVLIDLQGAEMDVHRSFSDEIGASLFSSRELLPTNIRNFLLKRGLVPYEKIKIEERIIPQGFPLFVFGTLGDMPSQNSGQPTLLTPGTNLNSSGIRLTAGRGLAISGRFPELSVRPAPPNGTVLNALNHLPGIRVQQFEMTAPASSNEAALPSEAAVLMNRIGASTPAGQSAKPVLRATVNHQNASGNLGDATLDPQSSVAICKGLRGDPFTISWQSQKEVVRALAWKSTLYIWGGPLLATVSLYFVLIFWGYLSS